MELSTLIYNIIFCNLWRTIKKEFNNEHIYLKVKGLLNKTLLSIDKHAVNKDINENIDDENNFFQFEKNENIYKENPLDLFLKSDNNSIEQIHSKSCAHIQNN